VTIVENLAVVGPGGTSGFIDTNSNGSATVPSDFLAYSGDRSTERSGYRPECVSSGNAAGNLFALLEAQHARRASAGGRLDTARRLKHAVQVRGSLAERTADEEYGLSRLIATPQFLSLRARNRRMTSGSRSHAVTS
jgi:hypothetical protein